MTVDIYKGAAIIVVDKESKRAVWQGAMYRKAIVENIDTHQYDSGSITWVYWRSGTMTGGCRIDDEGRTWIRGHGPMAKDALKAAQALLKGLSA